MENSASELQKKSAKRQAAIQRERQRLSYQTEELEYFDEAKKWIKKGIYRFLKKFEVRPQTENELENVATVYLKEQWQKDKRAGKEVTGGLVFRVTLTCLKKHIARDKALLSSPHPERIKANEERERLAKAAEEKLSYPERQYQENLKIDMKNIKDNLSMEGLIIIKGKLEEQTNIEIRVKLEGLGYRNGSKYLDAQLGEIREFLKEKGYP